MSEKYDVIIVGLGAMGSAACYHLARRGKKVLGLDRFSPPHTLGSSHGQTRIIREAYFEHPVYVPLVQHAYELWADLERESGRRLFVQTGGLMIGRPEGVVVGGAKQSAVEHRLQHEILSAAEVRRRFPALQPTDDMVAVWEPRAGILFPEACVETHLAHAKRHGADIHVNEAVTRWEADAGTARVVTSRGQFQASRLVLACGSWVTALLPDLSIPLTIERQVLYWFEAKRAPENFHSDRCPIYLWEHEPERFFYGFPDLGEGVKVAGHHEGRVTSPEAIDREIHADETEAMRRIIRKLMPDADGPLRSAVVCMYTNTPDHHFLIDSHPRYPQVLIASPCSGHGFKFSSAIGSVLADLLTEGKTRFELSLFRHRWPVS
ncbi:MAG: N-methyl-L-tryptophan oxidase [Verrucomicrobia bacterium]|nr:N-methyl-L-tryptophan oxidase [Verrucomicrobiota bacterium]